MTLETRIQALLYENYTVHLELWFNRVVATSHPPFQDLLQRPFGHLIRGHLIRHRLSHFKKKKALSIGVSAHRNFRQAGTTLSFG